MKKYIITVVSVTILLTQSLLCGDSKYERLLTDIETQNFSRLQKDLQDDEYLSPEQYEQLFDEATGFHEKLQKMLSILSDYRDFLSVAVGAPLTLACGLYGIEMIRLIAYTRIRHHTKALGLVVGWGILTSFFWYVTSKGYRLTYGRMPVENALAIVRAVEKARDSRSKLKAS